ncbi:MAG: type II toxin-antitoxin system YhaV family toxin [Heliomarina sp.]|uniref:type II toxin-antitoxin system YhaV family toxin n=1 Tax=Heliomarina sp. TaxID=2917556 RepID=UPI0040587DD2
MAARKSSLRDLAAKSRKDGLAAANTGPVAGRIAELDPGLVHAGGLADRLDVSQAEIKTLAESLRDAGQKVPILVRPHPTKPGEYEIVAGRRRLAACRLAGINVRAEIQELADPTSSTFDLRNTIGPDHRAWKRAKFLQQFRLFFRYDTASKTIIYGWVNDEKTKREYGSKTDSYRVFQKRLAAGDPPADWDDLIKRAAPVDQK